jgi:hypothetical protein
VCILLDSFTKKKKKKKKRKRKKSFLNNLKVSIRYEHFLTLIFLISQPNVFLHYIHLYAKVIRRKKNQVLGCGSVGNAFA